jgi:hypothetical protein
MIPRVGKRAGARDIAGIVVGGVLSVAGLVRPILASIGQARTLDQLLTPVIASWATPTHTLYLTIVGLILILFEVRKLSRVSPPGDLSSTVADPALQTIKRSNDPTSQRQSRCRIFSLPFLTSRPWMRESVGLSSAMVDTPSAT